MIRPDGTDRRMLVKDAGQPAWSPDGKMLAFLRVRSGNPDIYTINADGSGERRLTSDSGEDVDAAWSPDGKLIAFDSTRTGRSQIFVMNAEAPMSASSSAIASMTNNRHGHQMGPGSSSRRFETGIPTYAEEETRRSSPRPSQVASAMSRTPPIGRETRPGRPTAETLPLPNAATQDLREPSRSA